MTIKSVEETLKELNMERGRVLEYYTKQLNTEYEYQIWNRKQIISELQTLLNIDDNTEVNSLLTSQKLLFDNTQDFIDYFIKVLKKWYFFSSKKMVKELQEVYNEICENLNMCNEITNRLHNIGVRFKINFIKTKTE